MRHSRHHENLYSQGYSLSDKSNELQIHQNSKIPNQIHEWTEFKGEKLKLEMDSRLHNDGGYKLSGQRDRGTYQRPGT